MVLEDYLIFILLIVLFLIAGVSFCLQESLSSEKELVEEDLPYKIVGCDVYKNDYLNKRWVFLGEASC